MHEKITHTGFKSKALASAFAMTILGAVLASKSIASSDAIATMVGGYNVCVAATVGARAWYQHSQANTAKERYYGRDNTGIQGT